MSSEPRPSTTSAPPAGGGLDASLAARGLDVGPLAVIAVVALAAVVTLAVDPATGRLLRIAAWSVAAVTMLARSRHRPEPTGSWLVFGAANLVVAGAWLTTGPAAPDVLQPSAVALSFVGLAGVGVATILATPTWRHRVSLLDGAVLAVSGASALLSLVMAAAPEPLGTSDEVTVLVGLFAAMLGPMVMVASLSSRDLRPDVGSYAPAMGLFTLLAAGSVTALAAADLAVFDDRAGAAWTVSAVCGVLAAVQREPNYVEVGHGASSRPTGVRLFAMVVVVTTPAALTLLLRAPDPQVPLWVSLIAALLLGGRLAGSSAYALADVEEAAGVRFDALVDNAAEVMALLDEHRQVFYVSGAVRTTFGIDPERLVGRPPSAVIAPGDETDLEEVLARASQRPGVPARARLRLRDDDRRQRHVDVTVVDLLGVPDVGAIAVTIQDVTQRVALEAELLRQAQTDSLTGLVNRTVLIDRVDHALTSRSSQVAVLFIDVDGFKLINDGYGHAAGDLVLRMLASRLRSVLRTHDTAARMGGDEFVVLLEELTEDAFEDAVAVADRIHIACDRPVLIDGEPIDVAVSVGIALPEEGTTAEQLIASGDAAMYVAKGERRGTVVYEDGMRVSARSRLRLMRDVRTAIEDGDLTIDYQPIVDTDSEALAGVEALLRWTHPEMGAVRPDHILEHAAAAGRTEELTLRVLRTVAQDLAVWRRATGTALPVAVNLSAQQLLQVDPDEVIEILAGPGGDPSTLTLEVTETSLLGDLTAAAEVLARFRAAGSHVAIDDFGTGYASIGYLRELPLDRLKIDREFITGLRPPTVSGSFAGLIQHLATSLDLRTVAEGVESLSELDAVRLLGCDHVQGFLFSRGLPMRELVLWAAERDAELAVDHSALPPPGPATAG